MLQSRTSSVRAGVIYERRKGSHGVKGTNPFIIAAQIRVDVMVKTFGRNTLTKKADQSLLSRVKKYLSNPHELSNEFHLVLARLATICPYFEVSPQS